jgi:endonuclease YncB( thermonuclease family)
VGSGDRPVVAPKSEGRIGAACFNAEGLDLGKQMVPTGWALAYWQFSLDYVADEETASATRKGMWETTFTEPWEWRRAERR